jgi:Xaa-Pro dipeptidase
MTFPDSEYRNRYQRARALMERNRLDALFITDAANLRYFTGYPAFAEMSYPRPAVFILPRRADPVLIVHEFRLPFQWGGTVKEYSRVGQLPIELVKDSFTKLACHHGRIGAELGHEQHLGISLVDFENVKAALPKAEFVDASDLLWQLRMVKSPAEIAAIAQACRIHDAVFERCLPALHAGMAELEIDRTFRRAIVDTEADLGFTIVCVGDYDLRQVGGSSAPDKVLEEGDLLWVDLGVVWQGYTTDYCRAAVAGMPSAKQRDLWRRMQQILAAVQEATRPGIPVSELCQVQLDKAESLGVDMSTWTARRYGHGSGLHTTEPPYISLDDHTILEPGMVLHLEPGAIRPDGIYVREEIVVVTEDGCEILSHAPWELRAI